TPPEESEREERTDHRAEVIGGAVEAESEPARSGRDGIGDQRVARGRPDPLADPVRDPDREDLPGRLSEGDERPDERRERIAEDDQRLSPPQAVRPPARGELQEGGRRLRGSLDRPHRHGAGADDRRQEDRQQRVDHLARRVGEERDRGENDNVARKGYQESRRPKQKTAGDRSPAVRLPSFCGLGIYEAPILRGAFFLPPLPSGFVRAAGLALGSFFARSFGSSPAAAAFFLGGA